MTPTAAQHLAEAVVADGFPAHREALAALVADARRRNVTPIVVAVAGDPDEPVVVRLRALGRLVVEYSRLVEDAAGQSDDAPPAPAPEPSAEPRSARMLSGSSAA